MINESQPAGLNVSSYTVEEVETITSEYIMKNAVSMAPQLCSVYRNGFYYGNDQAFPTFLFFLVSSPQGKNW